MLSIAASNKALLSDSLDWNSGFVAVSVLGNIKKVALESIRSRNTCSQEVPHSRNAVFEVCQKIAPFSAKASCETFAEVPRKPESGEEHAPSRTEYKDRLTAEAL